MKLLAATITKAPRQVTTKYGERVVCDVKLEDGSESAIWGPKDYAPLLYLKAGQAVTVSKDSKGKIAIIENHLTHPEMVAPSLENKAIATNQTTNQSSEMSNREKREIAEYITQQTKLFSFCYSQTKLIDNLPDEDRRAVATTLYLQASKHFNLV
jgi:hypothetical protein